MTKGSRSVMLVAACIILTWVLSTIAGPPYEGARAQGPGAGRAEAKRKARLGREAYAGRETCLLCHQTEHSLAQAKTRHGRAMIALEEKGRGWSCEGCHRPGKEHVEQATAGIQTPKKMTPKELGGACLQCHKSRFRWHDWVKCQHATGDVKCVQCHDLENDKSKHRLIKEEPGLCLDCHAETRGEFMLTSHHPVVREKRMRCDDCHDPHRRMRLDPRAISKMCRRCHKEQRGPYIFEHGSISGGLSEACLDCHRGHGSPNPDLLKLRGRGLCLSCHADRVLHFPGASSCTFCHRAVHGSNTDVNLIAP